MNKGTLIEITHNVWYNNETVKKMNPRNSIQVNTYKVERLSALDKKLIEYVNKYDFKRLKQKITKRFNNMEDMYKMHNVHPTVIVYIENK